jgi:hypothetical protein
MKALVIYVQSSKEIILVQEVPGGIVHVEGSTKSYLVEETETSKQMLLSCGYDVTLIEEFEAASSPE